MTMQSDRDAALCEQLREISRGIGGWPSRDPLKAEAADRLESLSRQLSDAQRERDDFEAKFTITYKNALDLGKVIESAVNLLTEARLERDELRAAVSAARAEIDAPLSQNHTAEFAAGARHAYMASRTILDKHIPEHTEGGKPSKIGPGHVCAHGIRWPHPCEPCDAAAWKAEGGKP